MTQRFAVPVRAAACFALVAALCVIGGCAHRTAPSPPPVAAADNSATSLDWAGTYAGVVPCADCEGIETTITLGADRTYVVRTRYLGRSIEAAETRGTFAWNAEGSRIQLQGVSAGPSRYLVGENQLVQLDQQGNRITGPLADKYVLRKAADAASQAPEALFAPAHWRLTELSGRPVQAGADGGKAPTLAFAREGNSVSGFGGCNRFSGTFEFTAGDRIRFSKFAATQMACPDMAIETEFLNLLGSVDNLHVDAQSLVLNRARMAPLARFEAVLSKAE